jgi:glycosyltransferase involved in cell wall biosynthesis
VRIALVSQEYPPETAHGGIGTQTYLKAHGLAGRGHEVHVISASTDALRHEGRDGDVRVTRVPGGYTQLPVHTEPVAWLTYSAAVAAAVAALHERAPLDVVDFPEWAGEGFVHLLNRTEWERVPTVVQLHGPLVMLAHTVGWPETDSELYRVGTMMEATCLRLADAVFASGQCSRDWCVRHYGLRRERVPVLHTGVDTRLFAPRGGPKEAPPTVVFAGNVAESKGAGHLLEAACRLAPEFPGLRLRMLGRGEAAYGAGLRDRARAAGCPGLLELVGFVPQEELAEHFSRAHVFAAPSLYEGGPGFVYLEAMACGLPVIACAGSGAAEVVRPGQTGLLVGPGRVDELAEALRRLLSETGERERLGANGRRYVEEEADRDVCLGRLEDFYAAAAAGPAAGRPLAAGGCPA